MHTHRTYTPPERIVRLAEVDEVVPLPAGQDKLQVLQSPQQHLEQRCSAPNGGNPPCGEVDVGKIREGLVEITMEIVRSLERQRGGEREGERGRETPSSTVCCLASGRASDYIQ